MMKLLDVLDRPLCARTATTDVETELYQTAHMDERLPRGDDQLAEVYSMIARSNDQEMSRFDAWTNKGGMMLSASGVLLSLVSVSAVLLPSAQNRLVCRLVSCVMVIAAGLFFLATWNALMSLRARPLCRVDEDDILATDGDHPNRSALLRVLAASELAAYKNNIHIVNEKATRVNRAFIYFFYGCLLETIYLALSLITPLPGSG